MKKALFLLVLFVAVSSVTFGQTTKNILTTSDNATVEVYQKAPTQVKDKTAPATGTTITNPATKTNATSTSKSSAKGCCGMNGEKHACCAGMSKSDYKKGKKKLGLVEIQDSHLV